MKLYLLKRRCPPFYTGLLKTHYQELLLALAQIPAISGIHTRLICEGHTCRRQMGHYDLASMFAVSVGQMPGGHARPSTRLI